MSPLVVGALAMMNIPMDQALSDILKKGHLESGSDAHITYEFGSRNPKAVVAGKQETRIVDNQGNVLAVLTDGQIDLSGLSSKEKQKFVFGIPVVENKATFEVQMEGVVEDESFFDLRTDDERKKEAMEGYEGL